MGSISRTVNDMSQASEALQWAQQSLISGLRGGPVVITFERETRTTSQNALLWPLLQDIAGHVVWFDRKHSKEVWKDIITGSFRKAEFVPNIEGTGFVMTGLSTSRMTKAEFSDLITYIHAFGADQGVPWSESSLEVYAEYREAREQ